MSSFKKGDIVVLKTGTKPQVVEDCMQTSTGQKIACRYVADTTNQYVRDFRRSEDFLEYTKPIEESKTLTKLYLVKTASTPTYGTFLTKDSAGNFVLELKGDNRVAAYLPADLEEVKPYTVAIKTTAGINHYEAEKGSVAVYDILFFTDQQVFGVVTEIDTKKDNAGRVLKNAVKVQTTNIGAAT